MSHQTIPSTRNTHDMKGLLNGREQIDLANGSSIRVSKVADASIGSPPAIRLAYAGNEQRWQTPLLSLASDPTSPHVGSATRDFQVEIWTPANVLVVAGDAAAFVLDLSTGSIRHRLGLDFVGLATDILILSAETRAGVFVIVSTRRLWVLDTNGSPYFRYEAEGPIARYKGVVSGTLQVAEYDVNDPNLPIVERDIDLEP